MESVNYETGSDHAGNSLSDSRLDLTSGLAEGASCFSTHPRSTPVGAFDRGDYRAIQLPTLVEYCRHYAETQTADQPAFTHVIGGPGEHERITFAELDVRAKAIAAEIQRRGGAGHPVLVVLEPGVDYAASLFGCLYARAIAVPVYPPQLLRLNQTMPRLQAMVANAGAKCMLSSRDIMGESPHPMWRLDDSMAIAVDEIDDRMADDWDGVLPSADDVAILQYTSGSTGNPRGVVLPHHVLISNLNAVIEHYHYDGANSVQWVPPYHDMGLIGGIFVPIFRGVEAVVITPVDFVRNPLLWLQCIDHYNGTSNGSPNFGYELCVRKIKDSDCQAVDLDLSSWKVAIAGAEPVRASTLRRFAEKFSRFGFAPESFCPAFGMAETTVIATGSPLGQHYRTLTVDAADLQTGTMTRVAAESNDEDTPKSATKELVSCGVPVDSMALEIVDPQTRTIVADGTIGEIWMRGRSVATGYWNDPQATADHFKAQIVGDQRQDFLRTGDLGFRVDGELYVTGRLKELIIVNGRNLYPHDVEETVQSVSEAFRIDTGTAFSIDVDSLDDSVKAGGEQLVIVQELWRPKKFDAAELFPQIVAAVLESTGVTPHAVVLVQSGSLPKTSSGKLRRTDTQKSFLNNQLNELARWQSSGVMTVQPQSHEPPRTPTEVHVAEIWSGLLGAASISRHDDFFHLGGGSLLVARMLTEIAETMRLNVPMATLFRHPQLASFADAIDSLPRSADAKPLIPKLQTMDGSLHPLSHAQHRFWLLEQLGQTDAFVTVPVSVHLEGIVRADTLENAIDQLIARHPMLRAEIVQRDGDVFQRIVRQRSCPPIAIDSEAVIEPGSMFGVAIRHFDDNSSCIDFVFRHMICDANSVEILLADLQRIMCGSAANDPPAQTLNYLDYAAWDRDGSRDVSLRSGADYWPERLDGMPSAFNLPQRRPTRDPSSASTGCFESPVRDVVHNRVQRIAKRHGVTASMVYLTVFQTVLARYGDVDDFAIIIPTSNRPASDLSASVGCFVNPIPHRVHVDAGQTFASALASTRDRLLDDLDRSDVPFQQIVAAANVARTEHRMPLSQIMFLYQPTRQKLDRLGDLPVRSIETDYSAVTAYDWTLVVQPDDPTRLTLVSGENVDPDLAKEFFNAFETALDQSTLDVDGSMRLSALRFNSYADAQPEPIENVPAPNCLTRLRDHADRRRDHVAVQDDDASITYGRLDEVTDAVASNLRIRGVKPGALVGIELPRTLDLIIAIIGVWKARAAYVPLGLDFPPARRQAILDDAQPKLVIDRLVMKSLCVPIDEPERSCRDETISSECRGDDLAYVMHTSGSTGKPKGVAIQQHSVSNLLQSFCEQPGFDENDSMLAVTTMTFDISVLEMFLPLAAGGTVRLTSHSISDEPEAVAGVIDRFRPTHIQSTPSALRMLLLAGWKPDRDTTLLCGGEPLMPDLADELLSGGGAVWNVYGPTETTVWSTIDRVTPGETITIGRPIANTRCRVVDRHGLDSPAGVAGELHISGSGVARGYHDDPVQTDERFIFHDGERYYRTGDQVQWRGDGRFEFLARNDRQVKVRGFRIELDEVESALQRCDGVHRAGVVLKTMTSGASQLVAFCAVDSRTASVDSIRQQLADQIPGYMIPATFELRSSLPQTPAGKTNYAALRVTISSEPAGDHESPQGPIETTLAEAWCEILEIDSVGREDHFFDLGGNSLLAAQLFARLRRRFEIELPLSEIYQRPTVASLADAIVRRQSMEMDDLFTQLDSLSEDDVLRTLEAVEYEK